VVYMGQSMSIAIRKWGALFSAYFQDGLAYRASGYIWLMTDAIPALIMPLVWLSAYNGRPTIAGYSPSQMVMYYLVMVTITNFITSHLMWEIAMEIKEGFFSVYLVRPISFFQHQFIRNLAWRTIRTGIFLPVGFVLLMIFKEYVQWGNFYLGWQVWVAILLGHTLSFTLVFAMSLLALWLQEAHSVYELYYIPSLFLSGQLVPLSILPTWALGISAILPFRYTLALPTELIVGRLSPEAGTQQILIQLIWITIAVIAGQFLWRKGLKHYTGVGQ
jgi:ABC-2 type transport system permease protein